MLQENKSILFSNNAWHKALGESRTNYPYKKDDVALQELLDGEYFGSDAIIGSQAMQPALETRLKLVVTKTEPSIIAQTARRKIKVAA